MFVSWVFAQAVATCPSLPGAYCPYVERDGRNAGRAVAKSSAQPGDVVLFDWGGDGVADHVGIVERNNGSYLTTIEGNTSNGSGSQSNGGVVARRTRSLSSVRCVLRPTYAGQGGSAPGKIAVDGYWGCDTTTLAQRVAGTPVDGIVSSQDSGWRSAPAGLHVWLGVGGAPCGLPACPGRAMRVRRRPGWHLRPCHRQRLHPPLRQRRL